MTAHRRLLALLLALTVVALGACIDARERAEELDAAAGELTDRARFCLSVTRALTAVDAGSPETAADAAEEVLARAPDDLRDDARVLAEALRDARGGNPAGLEDPEVQAAARRLHDATRERCDPTS